MLVPLVTIAVTVYNSANYVLETLESIKEQTWGAIELIVSDDCSKDNSVQLCSAWIAANQHFFVRTEIITVTQNTGVSANLNRCIKASGAEWIKFIAGDDILLPGCIEENMRFVGENPAAAIVFSQVLVHRDDFKEDNFLNAVPLQFPMNLMNPAFSATDQFKLLLLSDRVTYTPSSFFKKEVLMKLDGFDEVNKLVEDYPMWLKLTKNGYRLFYFHTATVGYRMHNSAINNKVEAGLFKPLFLKIGPLKKRYVYPYLPWDIAYNDRYIRFVARVFQGLGLNKKTILCTTIYHWSTVYLNPFRYILYFKKHILKAGLSNSLYSD